MPGNYPEYAESLSRTLGADWEETGKELDMPKSTMQLLIEKRMRKAEEIRSDLKILLVVAATLALCSFITGAMVQADRNLDARQEREAMARYCAQPEHNETLCNGGDTDLAPTPSNAAGVPSY